MGLTDYIVPLLLAGTAVCALARQAHMIPASIPRKKKTASSKLCSQLEPGPRPICL